MQPLELQLLPDHGPSRFLLWKKYFILDSQCISVTLLSRLAKFPVSALLLPLQVARNTSQGQLGSSPTIIMLVALNLPTSFKTFALGERNDIVQNELKF